MWFLWLILSPIFNLIYIIFIYAPMCFLNILWQIFSWFSGLTIGNLFFGNSDLSANGTFNLNINWDNPVVKAFIVLIIVGLIFLIIFVVISQLMYLFKNKLSNAMYQEQSTPMRTFKWVCLFPLCFLAIPIMFIVMSIFTSFFAQLFEGVFGESFGSLGINYSMSQANFDYITNDLIPNLNSLQSSGTSDYTTAISNMITDLQNVDKSNISQVYQDDIDDCVSYLTSLKSQLADGWPNLSNIISLLQSITLDNYKNDTNASLLSQYLDDYNGSTGIIFNITIINSYLSTLQAVVDVDSLNGYQTYSAEFIDSNSPFLIAFENSNATTAYGSDAIGLISIPSYLETNTDETFFGVIFIYQFVSGHSDNNWSTLFYKVYDASAIINLFFGFVFVIMAIILVILMLWWLCKRIVELLIYLLISPIIVASATIDDGAKLGAWFKLVVAKMFSILILTVCFQAFFVLQPVVKNLAQDQLTSNFLGLVSYSDVFYGFFCIGGLISCYFATTKLSQFIGDDSSIAQTFAEMGILSKATKLAMGGIGLTGSALKMAGKGIGKGANLGAKRFLGGKKVTDKDGNTFRHGGYLDRKAAMKQSLNEFEKVNEKWNSLSEEQLKENFEKGYSYDDHFKDHFGFTATQYINGEVSNRQIKKGVVDRWAADKGYSKHHPIKSGFYKWKSDYRKADK